MHFWYIGLFNGTDILQKDCLSNSHDTQALVHTPIDPKNTMEYIPSWFHPVATLRYCTHDGRIYQDEHNDFGLEIPPGAIPEGMSISIDIGVALYGPFQYPEGLRSVSPVFWVCVRDQNFFQFLKPVKVTIPHFLNLKNTNDLDSLSLTFLKGNHELNTEKMFQFKQVEGDVLIEPLKKYGVVQVTHFCSLCISSKYTKELVHKALFCISALTPSSITATDSAHFFITFLLSTCLRAMEGQINKDPAIQGHKRQTEHFQFSDFKALEIVLPQSLPDHWEVGVMFRNKVCYKFCIHLHEMKVFFHRF